MKKTFTFGPIAVTVTDVGEGQPAWDKSGASHTEYSVSVKAPGASYRTTAWGSRNDFDNGVLNHEAMGAMVVGELASAAADPDEFIDLVSGDATGREAAKRVKDAEKIIKTAQKIGWPALEAATNEIRERGLD